MSSGRKIKFLRRFRVPGAVQRSSRCFAEPGPYRAPALVTAAALQRTVPQGLHHSASKTRVNALMALHPGHVPACSTPIRGIDEAGAMTDGPPDLIRSRA